MEELATAFDGVRFYDLNDNRTSLASDFAATIQDVANVSQSIGLIEAIPDLQAMVDGSFLR